MGSSIPLHRWRTCTVLICEHHIAWTHTFVHEITYITTELRLHLGVVHHLSWWATLHTTLSWVLLTHTTCWLLLSVLLMMLWTTLVELLALGNAWRHLLLHHHGIDALHLLVSNHSHLLLLLLVSLVWIPSSMLTTWANLHHLWRLLRRTSLWLL